MTLLFWCTLLASCAQSWEELVREATPLFVAGRIAESAALFSRAAALDPTNAALHANVGACELRLGDAGAALRALERATRLVPQLATAQLNRGIALDRLGRSHAARSALRLAVRSDPTLGEAHIQLASLNARRGHHRTALNALRIALRLLPASIEAHLNTCGSLHALERHAEALVACDAAIRLATAAPSPLLLQNAHVTRAAILAALGRHGEALAVLNGCLARDPSHVQANINAGAAQSMLERHGEAARAFERALRLAPRGVRAAETLDAWLKQIAALENGGLRADAARNAASALALAPHSEAAKKQAANLRLAPLRVPRGAACVAGAGGCERDVARDAEHVLSAAAHFADASAHEMWPLHAPRRYAHPSLRRMHVIPRVLDAATCEALIDAAEAHVAAGASGGWARNGHLSYEASGHGVNYRSSMLVAALVPGLRVQLAAAGRGVLERMLRLAVHAFDAAFTAEGDGFDELWYGDVFVVKYTAEQSAVGHGAAARDASRPASSMPKHRDWSELSFVVELSAAGADFDGGGTTWFSGDGAAARTFRQPVLRGGAVLFCGRIPHAGAEVTRGSRFIVAGFVRVRLRSGIMLPSCEARVKVKPTNLVLPHEVPQGSTNTR